MLVYSKCPISLYDTLELQVSNTWARLQACILCTVVVGITWSLTMLYIFVTSVMLILLSVLILRLGLWQGRGNTPAVGWG